MSLIDKFINLDIQKLFLSGRIDKAYEKMYRLADKLALHEMKQNTEFIIKKASKKLDLKDNFLAYPEEIAKFKQKRIEYHLNRMEKLLSLRDQIKKEKN